jgi:hypothetical protein
MASAKPVMRVGRRRAGAQAWLLALAVSFGSPVVSMAFRAPPGVLPRLRAWSCRQPVAALRMKGRSGGDAFHDMDGRGDLRGGTNRTRNAQIMALKKNFYSSPELSEDLPDTERRGGRGSAARRNGCSARPSYELHGAFEGLLGLMKDMPLCRWENVMLPGFNQVFNADGLG